MILLILLTLLCSCSENSVPKLVNAMTMNDTNPPVLLEVLSESDKEVRLVFNEKVFPYGNSFDFCNAKQEDNCIILTLSDSLFPGECQTISGRVADSVGNTVQLSVKVWGYNTNLPSAIINEVTTKGSDANPDRVELKILSDGNLAGLTLYAGIPSDYDSMIILPDIDVKAGDFVVISWNPSGKDSSSDLFFSIDASGLSSNNGCLVLSSSPAVGSGILDSFLYSSMGSSQYEGWGTKVAYTRANWVIQNGYWQGAAVNSSNSTATRSMSRYEGKEDSNSQSDWYVTVTGGATFGAVNTSAPY